MMSNILIGLNIIVLLAFVGLLVFLCFRTRSKGLILISAILLTGGLFSTLFNRFFDPYMGQAVNNWLTQSVNVGGYPMMMVELIKPFLYRCLCLLSVFLIYKEWRQGKFRYPST